MIPSSDRASYDSIYQGSRTTTDPKNGLIGISASLLAADFTSIADDIHTVEAAGADRLHIDIMDGSFVANISWGSKITADLRRLTQLPFDTHLMVIRPDEHIRSFREAGSDIISFHPEASGEVLRTVSTIRDSGASPGIALSPDIPVASLKPIINDVDQVIIMSVKPGLGGQSILPDAIQRIQEAREIVNKYNPRCTIEVDGGANLNNVEIIAKAGADFIVAGSSIFKTENPGMSLQDLKRYANKNR